jgi:hypothetical protein
VSQAWWRRPPAPPTSHCRYTSAVAMPGSRACSDVRRPHLTARDVTASPAMRVLSAAAAALLMLLRIPQLVGLVRLRFEHTASRVIGRGRDSHCSRSQRRTPRRLPGAGCQKAFSILRYCHTWSFSFQLGWMGARRPAGRPRARPWQLVARMTLVGFFEVRYDLTQIVGFRRLQRWIRLVRLQLLEPQGLPEGEHGKSVVHIGRARGGQ